MTLRANPPTVGSELVTKDMLVNEFFYNYSYQYFLDRINLILFDLSIFFRFNPVTGLISINGKYPANGLTGANIYVNEQLYNLLAGLQYIYYDSLPGINTPLYQLIPSQVQNVIGNLVNEKVEPQYTAFNGDMYLPLVPTYNSIITIQSYPSTQLWNPVTSIVFTSKCLSVVNDEAATPYIYGLNPNPPANNSNVSINLFEYSLGRRADPVINFINRVYLFKSLLSIVPEADLNLETFWKDDYGNLHPFFLESGANFSLKLMFRKHKDI
jgi:hypothetical protein